jgi:hypothetical protein
MSLGRSVVLAREDLVSSNAVGGQAQKPRAIACGRAVYKNLESMGRAGTADLDLLARCNKAEADNERWAN